MKATLTMVFVLCCFQLLAQQNEIDSLVSSLKGMKDDSNKVTLLNTISEKTSFIGNVEQAKYYLNQALELATKVGFKKGYGHAYSDLGSLYLNLGNFPEALKDHLASLKAYEEIHSDAGVASCYGNIGNVFLMQGNYPEALKNYEIALKMQEKIGNKQIIESLYNNIGSANSLMGNHEKALKNYQEGLKVSEEIDDKVGVAYAYGNIGLLNMDKKDYAEAFKDFSTALKIEQEINDQQGVATAYLSLGGLCVLTGKYAESRDYLTKSLQLSKELNIKSIAKGTYIEFARLDSATGNFKEAYNNYHRYVSLSDSMVNEESSKQISQLKIQYETEKKDNLIKLLNKDEQLQASIIDKQKTARKYLIGGFLLLVFFSTISFYFFTQRRKTQFKREVSEVEMKALRAQMNPHFIFNSLNSIHRYMLQHDIENASEYLIKFSRLVRLILENSRQAEVSLKSDLEALELYIQLEAVRLSNKFTYELDIANDINPEDTLIPPLILQPFVENSIWHGLQHMQANGKIIIRISKRDNMLYCVVEDNGVGRKKLTVQGDDVNLPKSESLGIKITNARIDIINKTRKANASVKLSDLAQGFRVEIQLPFILSF